MRSEIAIVYASDLERALDFYTRVLGFTVDDDINMGAGVRWLTVRGAAGGDLSLMPDDKPWIRAYQQAAWEANTPLVFLTVDDIDAEHARLAALGVRFTIPPADAGPIRMAVFDDTCGNWVMMAQRLPA